MSVEQYAILAVAALVAGLLKGVSGLGEAIPLTLVGVHLMDPVELLFLIAATDLITGMVATTAYRSDPAPQRTRGVMAWFLGSLLVGLALVATGVAGDLNPPVVSVSVIVVGIVLLVMSMTTGRERRGVLVPGAVVGGFFGGVSGVNGPPVALALTLSRPGVDHRREMIELILASSVIRVIALVIIGVGSVHLLGVAVGLLPLLALGVALGRRWSGDWSGLTVHRVIAGICIAGGVAGLAA